MNSSKYFSEDVLACSCCGYIPEEGIAEELLDFLDALQDEIEEPLEVVSCARCVNYNKEIGGHKNSYHVQGIAVDIAVPESMTIDEFADICEECDGNGQKGLVLKIEEGIIHIDFRGHYSKTEED